MSFSVVGLDTFADDLREFAAMCEAAAAGVEGAVDLAAKDTADKVRYDAKLQLVLNGSLRSGNLLRSIEYRRVGYATYAVGSDLEYAPYVEFGTRPHLIGQAADESDADDDNVMRFIVGGEVIYTRAIEHPGSQAKPYLQPAITKNRQKQTLHKKAEERISNVFESVFGTK